MKKMIPCLLRKLDKRIGSCLSSYSNSANFPKSRESKRSDKTHNPLGKDFVPEPSNPDVFGTLNKEWRTSKIIDRMPEEEDDRVEVNFIGGREGKTRLRTKEYADMIKKFVREKKILDALDVLEKRMLQEDRVKPENYIYNLLIGSCARVGYTKKAFQLFNQMKKRGLKVTGGTYTSLFNACSSSPWSSDGLKRANHLRELMKEKGVVANQTNYHAMIKAYGRCGAVPAAFALVDEMLSNGVEVSSVTINFLLQACASDKESGFRHALLVWRKMLEKDIAPTIYTYNLLLRCIRDCGAGSKETILEDIAKITGGQPSPPQMKAIEGSEKSLMRAGEENLLGRDIEPPRGVCPNLIARTPHMGTAVGVGFITKSSHRLMLVGGCSGFVESMSSSDVPPDIKTVTQLLDIIPSTLDAENMLLEVADEYRVQLDIDFCNMLIKKRNMRGCHEDAKDVLKLINERRLSPDIVTFGVLALGCRSDAECGQFLKDLEDAGFRPNIEILGSLLRSSCRCWSLGTIFKLMYLVIDEGINVNEPFLKHLEQFFVYVQKEIDAKESGHHKVKNKHFLTRYKELCSFYDRWKKEVTLEDPDKIHPWEQFKRKRTPAENSPA